MNELRTGITCVDNFSARGDHKTEEKQPQLGEDIRSLADPESQVDPKFQSPFQYTRMTAKAMPAARAKGEAGQTDPRDRRDLRERSSGKSGVGRARGFLGDFHRYQGQTGRGRFFPRRDRFAQIRQLVINLDNGPQNSSCRTQFIKRMVEFADRHHLEIVLVYYPPYHSKYNPIERCWGILEEHWNETPLNWQTISFGVA